MAEATDARLNPGSDEAYERGCKCPRMDNAYGRGYLGGVVDSEDRKVFVCSDACPLHGAMLVERTTDTEEE